MTKILFAASECSPFVKTGGLADVASALPRALASQYGEADENAADVRVVLPLYAHIKAEYASELNYICDFTVTLGWRSQYCGVAMLKRGALTYYFIDNEFYFGRSYIYGTFNTEEAERFGFFSKSVIELMYHVDFFPDILHLNDWQTGMAAAVLKLTFGNIEPYTRIKTVLTIHNLKFQGIFDKSFVKELLSFKAEDIRVDTMEFDGAISYLKAGIVYSDVITTVSPSYAREIQTPFYGEKLDGLLRARSNRLFGILNGIDTDEFSPQSDALIEKSYSADDMSGKAACKAALMRELGLNSRAAGEEEGEKPLFAIVSRLTDQKGLDLVEHVINELIDTGLRLAVLGTGDRRYEDLFSWAQWRFPNRVAARIEYSDALAHRIYAGADFFLMPSRFEPCGLSQLIALTYGTIPVVRETGGLRDTVEPYNKYFNTGTGFSFANYNAHELLYTVQNVCGIFYGERRVLDKMRLRGMRKNFDWRASAKEYMDLYKSIAAPGVLPA